MANNLKGIVTRGLHFCFNWMAWAIKTRSIPPTMVGNLPFFQPPITEKEQRIGQRVWQEFKEREPERCAELEAYQDRCDREEEEWRHLPWWRRLYISKPRR